MSDKFEHKDCWDDNIPQSNKLLFQQLAECRKKPEDMVTAFNCAFQDFDKARENIIREFIYKK